jgi:Poly A polymerase head domain
MLETSTIRKEANKGFYNILKTNPKVGNFIEQIQNYGELIILGGALRDFSFNRTPRDIDIMINSTVTNFDDIMKNYNYKRNRFGGYSVCIDDFELDIWSIKNNWAFKNHYYDISFKNVTKGSFFNVDAIAYNLNTGDIDADSFVEALKYRILDINLESTYITKNPDPEKNVVRALRLRKTWNLEFSNILQDYCKTWFKNDENSKNILYNIEKRHYGNNVLNQSDFDYLYNN